MCIYKSLINKIKDNMKDRQIENEAGLVVHFLRDGRVKSIETKQIRLSLKQADILTDTGCQLYLRKRSDEIKSIALTGGDSGGLFRIHEGGYHAGTEWENLNIETYLELSQTDTAYRWRIEIKNSGSLPVDLDVVYRQDVGLKTKHDGLVNEYYVSQYLERRILNHKEHGAVVCCRQNMLESTGNPWLLLGSKHFAGSGSTDGMQFYGKIYRETGQAEALKVEVLGGDFAGESSVVALQEEPFRLQPGETKEVVFYGIFMSDHPGATSEQDLNILDYQEGIWNSFIKEASHDAVWNLTTDTIERIPFFPADTLSESEITSLFGSDRRHSEYSNGELLSFFYSKARHVVLKKKELLCDRPHGHIIQAKSSLAADEQIVSTTCYAAGIFNSHLSQGNTNFNVLLSICTDQFNQSPTSGQRFYVEIENQFYLLGVPSAFEMGLNFCRWIYKFGRSIYQVRTWTSKLSNKVNTDFKVLKGSPLRIVLAHQFDELNGWNIQTVQSGHFMVIPSPWSMTAEKFPEGRFRIVFDDENIVKSFDQITDIQWLKHLETRFIVELESTSNFKMSILGELKELTTEADFNHFDEQFETDVQLAEQKLEHHHVSTCASTYDTDLKAINEIIPWYYNNALTHFLTPHGLEQFGGAAWGTRDVSQGPFDFLMSTGNYEDGRNLLLTIFANQNADGGWPQWWMFDRYQHIRAHEAHGDIFYWVIIALSNYVRISGDVGILNEKIGYYHENEGTDLIISPVREHMERLLGMIQGSFIPGTSLVPYGGGDWNDSLQPVNKALASSMVSSWTVEMNYQAFIAYSEVYLIDGQLDKANQLIKIADNIKDDFNRYLVKDSIVAGYGIRDSNGNFDLLLHPSDKQTGIRYSILPMDRGIVSGIFSYDQAMKHLEIVETKLKGPDGARLMDRPLKYRGGIQKIFQRAESSTFFGREIGIMYVHEHLRYAESQSIMGFADAFIKALRQANPVDYQKVVEMGDTRQSNCYYSSSDVAFKTRYEADEKYEDVINGLLTLRGGWRVYSSGPGIFITLVMQRLYGIRPVYDKLIIDPVMPKSMNMSKISCTIYGKPFTVNYIIMEGSYEPKRLTLNGTELTFTPEYNPYRKGGAVVDKNQLLSLLKADDNQLDVYL